MRVARKSLSQCDSGSHVWTALLALLIFVGASVVRADELVLTTSFTYNENDAVETVTTPDGVVATIGYDEVDRPVSLSYSQGAGGVSAITYTDLGQVASVTDSEGTIEFHYVLPSELIPYDISELRS